MDIITADDLNCLNAWPEGTVGYQQERDMIAAIHQFGIERGYGRVSQLASAMYEIAMTTDRDKEIAKRQAIRDDRMQLLEASRHWENNKESIYQKEE